MVALGPMGPYFKVCMLYEHHNEAALQEISVISHQGAAQESSYVRDSKSSWLEIKSVFVITVSNQRIAAYKNDTEF